MGRFVARVLGLVVGIREVWCLLLGGFLFLNPSLRGGRIGAVLRLILGAVRFIAFWGVVWVAIWRIDETLLVGSRSGLQTVLQVLLATIVALLVLVLGSLFVLVQTMLQLWGTRASVMLGLDEQVQMLVAQPLIVASVALLIAGQVPDAGPPAGGIDAAAAVLVLAAIRILFKAATAMPALTQKYTLPRGFPQYVIRDVGREFASKDLGLVVMRVSLLTEMLRLAIDRGDSVAVASVFEALGTFHRVYLDAVALAPELRDYLISNGQDPVRREGWFAEDLAAGLVAAAEDGLQRGRPARDLNGIAVSAGTFAVQSVQAGQYNDAAIGIDALTQMGTLTQQQVSGFTTAFTEPAFQLSVVEASAEKAGHHDVAAEALAGLALLVGYPVWAFRLGQPHPYVVICLHTIGPAPPWALVEKMLASDGWLQRWANKIKTREIVLEFLEYLRQGFAVRSNEAQLAVWFRGFMGFVLGVSTS
jgi:hypothetical protein